MSHPVWVRGLKQRRFYQQHQQNHVAPRVGAWIETPSAQMERYELAVAPRVGAWIETY